MTRPVERRSPFSRVAASRGTATTIVSRDKSDALLLIGACLLVLLPHARHLPLWASATAAALLAWRGWITWRGNRMPPRWLLLPIALGAMGGVFATHGTLVGRDAGVTMLALLLAFKLLEMHARRDLFVVVFLAFFLMLTTFFYAQTMLTALAIVCAVIAILAAQLSFQYGPSAPPLGRRLRFAARIVLLAAPLTVVMFLLFPRVEGPLWGTPGGGGSGTGLSDTMSPGSIAHLALSDDIAFQVQFADPPPPKALRYWRGAVLSDYDGRTWRQRPLAAGTTSLRTQGPALHYRVTLEPSRNRWLYALDAPLSPPQLRGNAAIVAPDLQLLSMRPVDTRVRYDMVSQTDYVLQADAVPAQLREWVQLPPGFNPQTMEFASRLRAQSADDFALVQAVLRYFRDQPFRYTLDPPLLGRDGVDEFLFSTRAGFCEHYAGAFVVLMRALDIPARVVTGYQGGEINPVDGMMTVRQSDAHAWAEVWLPGRGWIRVDPTAAVAPERIEHNLRSVLPANGFGPLAALEGGWLRSPLTALRDRWEAAATAWNQWVLNYSAERQKNLAGRLGFPDADWRILTLLMVALGGIAIAVATLPLLRERTRSDPVDRLYSTFCSRMAQRGLRRDLHEGPRAYRGRITAAPSPLSVEAREAASRFLTLYETARYGVPGAGRASRAALLAALKSSLARCR
ncbi:MAG: transglutaminase TgpA family protein [Burkholderiaceae bacterium]